MGRLALGRESVMRRLSLPFVPRQQSMRIIPPEPDELWDAIALQIRNNDLRQRIESANQVRGVGLLQELRRNEGRLAVLLERMEIDGDSFNSRLLDTPAVVLGTKLSRLTQSESVDAFSLSNPNDLVVSVQGRGFPFMAEFWVRAEYTTSAGSVRAFPMRLTAQSPDLTALEFSAGAPLSSFNAAAGSVVTLIMVFELRSRRFVTRAFERFTVV